GGVGHRPTIAMTSRSVWRFRSRRSRSCRRRVVPEFFSTSMRSSPARDDAPTIPRFRALERGAETGILDQSGDPRRPEARHRSRMTTTDHVLHRSIGRSRGTTIGHALWFALVAFVWTANTSGLISSNDGSHLALARALVLRARAPIDPDRALTLEVDLAERDGHAYSDRPPGTAFAALPAVWLGDRLDPRMLARAMEQARAGREVEPLPGARPYITTYAARTAAGSTGPKLAALIGSSIAISIHAVLIGLLGLALIDRLLLRGLEIDARGRLFAVGTIALATAWGPYSTTLFAHVSAAT